MKPEEAVDKWEKLEQVFRRILREELQSAGLSPKLGDIKFINGKWEGVTDIHMNAWRDAYGSVNIEAELRRAAAWCSSNPQSAPKSKYARFLNAWLSKEQNRSAIRSIPTDKMLLAAGEPRTCAYCDDRAVGTVGHIRHCAKHIYFAMDGKKVA